MSVIVSDTESLWSSLDEAPGHNHSRHFITWTRGGWCIGCQVQAANNIEAQAERSARQAIAEIKDAAQSARRRVAQQVRRAVERSKGKS